VGGHAALGTPSRTSGYVLRVVIYRTSLLIGVALYRLSMLPLGPRLLAEAWDSKR
jgi:hypothetical protein